MLMNAIHCKISSLKGKERILANDDYLLCLGAEN